MTIIKNEVDYVGYCIMSILPYVDEIVYADGNSTDGTIELIKYIQKRYDKQGKIKLFENQDCKNLQDDYVRLFNWTLAQCESDYVWFLHPDMICLNPEKIKPSLDGNIRYSVNVMSIAGEKRNKIFVDGRSNKWFTIYRNAYGLHYYGYYGTPNEDFYFRDLTGNRHICHNEDNDLPYEIKKSPITVIHYCDTKPYKRRYERLLKCLKNTFPGWKEERYKMFARKHPRVTLKDGIWMDVEFKFAETKTIPKIFKKYNFDRFRRKRG